jgi:hypothetical protein
MFKQVILAGSLLALLVSFSQAGEELSIESLSTSLKAVGLYKDNKVMIGKNYYIIKSVSAEKGGKENEFVVKFVAKPDK